MNEKLSFKEFYLKKYPSANNDWGASGEYIHDVYQRIADTFAEYTDKIFLEKFVDELLIKDKIIFDRLKELGD